MNQALSQRREKYSKLFMNSISLIGWILILFSFVKLEHPGEPIVLGLLFLFLLISEYYPMPVWRGQTAITFPVVYVLFLLYGFSYTAIAYAGAVLIVNLIHQRPLRTVFFNPAQLVLSFYAAAVTLPLIQPLLDKMALTPIIQGIFEYIILLAVYVVINNLIVDLVLFIRPQNYSFKMWKHKTITEMNSAAISLIYGITLYVVGSQNRGEIDVFAYFFFFSPLVGISLLSATIARLRREKNRLKLLFSITTELNQMLPSQDWLSALRGSFNELIGAEASLLWIKRDGEWELSFKDGRALGDCKMPSAAFDEFKEMRHPVIYNDRKKAGGAAADCFDDDVKAFVYSPLVIENETIGMFIIARSRTKSFQDDDVQSIATLANQLAVIIKTRMLFTEKEKRIVLEERNRIARDIHDGVAQTLAGAVMKLETAGKKFNKNPEETRKLVDESVLGLRESLKEVRESIYALRPYPTERAKLAEAILRKIEAVQKEYKQEIAFEIRGQEQELSPMVEKVLFDTFQESLQNAIKHSQAAKIEILLSYQSEHILLKIKDDGSGFSLFQAMLKARNQPHFGILQMNDAAEKINASLQIDSKEGSGTEVVITVPRMGIEGGSINDQAHASG
ncbi:sensor histidine kinase [Mesobacillus subterraneus]|uniref:GAF domain-containing sensor histidine kinase n=1 Tax=Mesobacillus subterraneus TaxID=285983 RepID=UPI00203DC1E0|nr:histidine kinase [Mesobacillus subterraneus]MCM3663538.1 sensor histidine kinase [Mesobacillus subterraneus]MCM3683305.1 sensor histidine kinase [Mesobacillus subterraneus]